MSLQWNDCEAAKIRDFLRELDARNAPVQFDEREEETAPYQTGLRRPGENLTNRHREANVPAPLLDSTHQMLKYTHAMSARETRPRLETIAKVFRKRNL